MRGSLSFVTEDISYYLREGFAAFASPFVDQRSPDYARRRRRERSLQRRFPIVDILFRSGDIRDRSAIFGAISDDFALRSRISNPIPKQAKGLYFRLFLVPCLVLYRITGRPKDCL